MSFATAHPWMTFWLVLVVVCLLDNMVSNVCRAVISRKGKE